MKKIIIIAAIAVLAAFLIGCAKKDYKDDASCSDVIGAAEKNAPVELGYESFDQSHVRFLFDDIELYDSFEFRYSTLSENINEFGIFHAVDEKACNELYEDVEEYLDELYEDKKAFISSYAPDELPKLERAQVKKFGNYVAYAILSDEERDAFFNSVKSALLK